jgi:acyl-CoA thioesterase-1
MEAQLHHPSTMAVIEIVCAGVFCMLLAGMAALIYMGFRRKPRNTPSAYMRRGRRNGSRTVVCAGDSHTHASLSADYVAILQKHLDTRGYEFINAGLNGNTSLDLLDRLDEIVRCQPDAVSVMIGTNDVRGGFSQAAEQAFEQNLRTIVTRLRSEAHAPVALLSVAPLGEDLAEEANQRVDRCNDVIRRVARECGADYLPLNESLGTLIENSGSHSSRPFKLRIGLLLGAAVRRYIAHQTWDTIAGRNRLIVHTDQIHLNDSAGKVVADLIAGWLGAMSGGKLCGAPTQISSPSENFHT